MDMTRTETQNPGDPTPLLVTPPRVVNVGLELFATNLASQGAEVVHVQWAPPAGGNAHLMGLLDKLRG
jgi:FdrA protein